jgi:4-alpha-glucanotransferase
MPKLRVVLAFHLHQPSGQRESVFEHACSASYSPLLHLLEKRLIPVALHASGPLLEWLLERHPELVARLHSLIARGQVEILGGGLYEPVLTMIPHPDRIGQIQAFSELIRELFATPVRGIWLAEGAWEQRLVIALAQAGIEYTMLDEFHFERSPVEGEGPFGYCLTECEGYLLKAFAASPALANGISFAEPSLVCDFLARLARQHPGSTIVFPVDVQPRGSRADGPPEIDRIDWIERFCDIAQAGGDWLEFSTLAHVADRSLPLGKVSLSDSAHRWRNHQSRRAEAGELYARMLGISQRLAAAEAGAGADPDYLEVARLELYRGQCSSAYSWHDGSGGLARPHLRNAAYGHLIAADNALDEIEGRIGPRVRVDVGDFNLDARQEVRLENDCLIALARPASGGHVYELDVRDKLCNTLATLDRGPDAFHSATPELKHKSAPPCHDRHPRKALVDHFYPVEATLDDVSGTRNIDCGDFAVGTFQAKVQREPERVSVVMERAGRADGRSVRVRKTITLARGEAILRVHYQLEEIPVDACFHFAVEINLAGMSDDLKRCVYSNSNGTWLGSADSMLDLPHEIGLALTGYRSELSVSLAWSQAAGLWCFPIETTPPLEQGAESVHQSCAVIPHWHVSPDEKGRWSVLLQWSFAHAASAAARSGTELSRAG